MKRLLLILASFLFIALTVCRSGYSEELLERILAVVNDEIITEQDLQIAMAPITAQYRTRYADEEFAARMKEARRDFLNKLIEDKLILSEAKRKQVIVKDAEVDEMMAEVRNKFPSRDVFLKAIQEQGLTEKKLWNRFKDQVMTQKLVSFEVRSKVYVSPGEVNEYYKAHESEFTQGDRVRLLHILIRVGPRTEDEAKSFALNLADEIRKGKPFDEAAKAYSEGAEAKEGGEMGWMEKGQLLGEIDEQVFKAPEGGVVGPLPSSIGYHIFKIVERKQFAIKPISEVRDEIQDIIFREKMRNRLDKWIASLKKNAYISIR